jgi:hypothetical protein
MGKGASPDVTDAAGLRKSGWSIRRTFFGGLDGDGDLCNLFVACHGPNLLFRTDGNGIIREKSAHGRGRRDDDGWGQEGRSPTWTATA